MARLISEDSKYKKQKQKAKALFRQMQLMDIEPLIPLLANTVIAHYRPQRETGKFKRWLLSVGRRFRQTLNRFRVRKKHRVLVVKSEKRYQLYVWREVCEGTRVFLSHIVAGAGNSQVDAALRRALRPLNLDLFLCTEQAVQIAFLESMRYFSPRQLAIIENYQDKITADFSGDDVPIFLFELRRALQWTQLLRREWDLLKKGQRTQPTHPIEYSAELIFK
jgi:hypothetical protein